MTLATPDPAQTADPPPVSSLDPFRISDPGPFMRLEDDATADNALLDAIASHGQQVPVIARPDPSRPGHYQIVAGRRRVLACRDLGRPVLASVQVLDDENRILVQGQDNVLRRDLSFIEKANYARQLAEAGYPRRVIGAALSANMTLVSRMLAVFEAIPPDVVAAIGAAPSFGRGRWTMLKDLFAARSPDIDMVVSFVALAGPTSDQRFAALVDMLQRGGRLEAAARAQPRLLRGSDGRTIGRVTQTKRGVTLSLRASAARGFEIWLADNLTALHRQWVEQAEQAAEEEGEEEESLQL